MYNSPYSLQVCAFMWSVDLFIVTTIDAQPVAWFLYCVPLYSYYNNRALVDKGLTKLCHTGWNAWESASVVCERNL